MKDMAHAGKAVMAIVQQPSTDIFNQFDKIYLMSSGREFYQGPTTDIYSYFEKIGKPIPQYTNPGDYVINLMHAKEKPDASEIKLQNEMFAAYDTHARKSITEQITHDMEKAAPIDASAMKELRGSTFGQQCKVLLVRAFKNLIRNKRLTQARIFQTIIISIVLDILFYRKTGFGQQDVRSKNSVLFFMSMTQMMGTMQSVVLSCTLPWSNLAVVPLERALFLREYANRMYHTLPYYLSKTAVELPYQLCLPIFFSILVYWIVGLRNTAECFWIFGTLSPSSSSRSLLPYLRVLLRQLAWNVPGLRVHRRETGRQRCPSTSRSL